MLIFFLFGELVQGLETRKLEGLGNSENFWKIDTSRWRVYARGSEVFLVTDLTSSNRKIKMTANSQKTDFTH